MDKVTTWVKYVELKKKKKESDPQGASRQRKKKRRNQGEPGKRKSRDRRSRRGEIAQAGDSIWLPECKIQTRTLRDDQARVIRAEGTSATVGTALLEEPAQRRWGSQWIRTSHA